MSLVFGLKPPNGGSISSLKLFARLRMIKTTLVYLMISFLFVPLSSFAQSAGVEIKSENFVLVGDVSEREGKRLIKDLEIFRLSLFKMLNADLKPEATPVKIYAINHTTVFQDLVKNETVAGVYKKNSIGPIFILDAKKGFKPGEGARRVALHEYVHHVIATYTNQKFPRWYNEGYANFLANFQIKKGRFIIGAPDRNYEQYLKYADWMPMDVLITSVDNYPFLSGSTRGSQRAIQNAFYAQSWLAVTYLQTHPNYSRKAGEYLQRVHTGENSVQAFTSTFNQSPEEFGEVIEKFVKKGIYKHYPFPLSDSERKPKMTSRKLNDGELKSAILDAKIHFNSKL